MGALVYRQVAPLGRAVLVDEQRVVVGIDDQRGSRVLHPDREVALPARLTALMAAGTGRILCRVHRDDADAVELEIVDVEGASLEPRFTVPHGYDVHAVLADGSLLVSWLDYARFCVVFASVTPGGDHPWEIELPEEVRVSRDSIACAPDGSQIVFGYERALFRIDVASRTVDMIPDSAGSQYPRQLSFSADGSLMLDVAQRAKRYRMWNAHGWSLAYKGKTDVPFAHGVLSDHVAVFVDYFGRVFVQRTSPRAVLEEVMPEPEASTDRLAISPDRRSVLLATRTEYLVWPVATLVAPSMPRR